MYYDDICSAASFLEVSEATNPTDIKIRWKNSNQTVQGNSLDTLKSVQIWRNDEMIQEIFTSNMTDTLEYIDVIAQPDYYRYTLCAVDINNRMGQMQFHAIDWFGGPIEGIVIIELDGSPITGSAITTCLQNLGYSKPIYIAQNVSRYPLEATLDAVFVPLGIYPNNHTLADAEAEMLKQYLELGGNLYLEGGDTWYFDPQTVLHPMFSIQPVADGTGDLNVITGKAGTFTELMSFNYNGENSWIDHIDPISPAFTIFSNSSPSYNCAVAYYSGTYKTIGASFEFGGLVDATPPSTKMRLLEEILDFFNVIVPVELTSFTVRLYNDNVILNWSTATELNNLGFEIERSDDSNEFLRLGFVEGHGTTTEMQEYSFIDNTLLNEGNYSYRLKQIDLDGTVTFSEIVEIEFNNLPTSFVIYQNYPNPFNSSTVIKYEVPEEKQITITLYNSIGEEVSTVINEVKKAGRYSVTFDSPNLPSGIYFYRIIAGNFVDTKKMILLK